MAKRITPMSRKYMDATPTPEPGGIDLVDLLEKIGEKFRYLQDTNIRAGRDVNRLQAGIPKINLGKPTATPTPNPAAKAMMDYATASMKFGKKDDPRRGRGFKVR